MNVIITQPLSTENVTDPTPSSLYFYLDEDSVWSDDINITVNEAFI